MQFTKDTSPERLRLDGLKVVVDRGGWRRVSCRAGSPIGSLVRKSVPLGVSSRRSRRGYSGWGLTHPQMLQETVVASGADIGLALNDNGSADIMNKRGGGGGGGGGGEGV